MHYIVNSSGSVVGSSNGPVNADHLKSFGVIAIHSDLELPPLDVAVVGFPEAPRIVESQSRAIRVFKVTTTAADTDGDGVPELHANGSDAATITVEAQDADGVPVTFRTTAGRLDNRIVNLSGGKASVQLTAGQDTVTVHVMATAPDFAPAIVNFEFIP